MKAKRKTKVLFFVWGNSIHARRRIQIFTEDSDFEVGVISTFAYDFENASNYYLASSGRIADSSVSVKIMRALAARLLLIIFRMFDRKTTLYECYAYLIDPFLIRRYAKEFKPDVVFLQTLLYPCYLSFILPKRIPSIITFWNGDVLWWAKWNGIERLLKKKIVTYGVRRADGITVNSQSAFDACLGYGANTQKVHLIRYPGVDLAKFRPGSKADARQKLEIAAEKVLLCPRGLGEYLNSEVILEAATMVIEKFPAVLFIFLSGEHEDKEWELFSEKAQNMGIGRNIRRGRNLPWKMMPLYYNAADVVVSISSEDSLPNCMLEAMACGTPLVMGDIPQIREWVSNEVNGLLVPPRDAEALSKAVLKIMDGDGRRTAEFVQYNLALAGREFDSRKNSLVVKQLVHQIAGKLDLGVSLG